jgi:hypothetical protein
MRHRSSRPLLIGLLALAPAIVWPAGVAAQDRPRPAFEFAAGWVGFADDGVVSEGMVGGAARLYLTPRVAVGPEIAYMNGENHSHLMLTGNLTFDLIAGDETRVVPFIVAGAGMFQTRETFVTGPFTSTEGSFTAGGGVRGYLSDRLFVAGEARIGWETHIRVNAAVGFQLTR